MSDSTATTQTAATTVGQGQEPTTEATTPAPVPTPAMVAARLTQPSTATAEGKVFSEDYVQSLRAESANYRTRGKEAETALKAAEARLAELDTLKAKIAQMETEAAQRTQTDLLTKTLGARNAIPVVGDAIRGAGHLNDFAWTDSDAETKLGDIIDIFLKDHPELVRAPAQARSGAPMSGQAGPVRTQHANLQAAVEAALPQSLK